MNDGGDDENLQAADTLDIDPTASPTPATVPTFNLPPIKTKLTFATDAAVVDIEQDATTINNDVITII